MCFSEQDQVTTDNSNIHEPQFYLRYNDNNDRNDNYTTRKKRRDVKKH